MADPMKIRKILSDYDAAVSDEQYFADLQRFNPGRTLPDDDPEDGVRTQENRHRVVRYETIRSDKSRENDHAAKEESLLDKGARKSTEETFEHAHAGNKPDQEDE